MRLIFTLEGGNELTFNVHERSVTIGRSSNCRIVLPYETFSRNHCIIEFLDEQIIITDTDSSNGVYINHQRIPAQVPTPYRKGELLKIGTAVVELIEDSTSPKVPIELAMNKDQGNETGSHLYGGIPRKSMFVDHTAHRTGKPKYSNPVSARSSSRKKRVVEEDSESYSMFDPVGIIVIVLMLSGYIFYRQTIIKTAKKQPPPYHKPYTALED